MAKKTKKEKIEAEKRRERFLYSLETLEREKNSETGKAASAPVDEHPKREERARKIEDQVSQEDFSYLKKDLAKITILATLLFGIQILLYLTIFARL